MPWPYSEFGPILFPAKMMKHRIRECYAIVAYSSYYLLRMIVYNMLQGFCFYYVHVIWS